MNSQPDSAGGEPLPLGTCPAQKRALELVVAARCLLNEAFETLRAAGWHDPGLGLQALVQHVNAHAEPSVKKEDRA